MDWKTIAPVIAKIQDELKELEVAETPERRQSEGGDVLFAVVNLLRWMDVDPEMALRETNSSFRKRFGYIEEQVAKKGKHVEDVTFEVLDALWDEAKEVLKDQE